jgi:hypothetical protein
MPLRAARDVAGLGTWLVHTRARSVITGTTFTRTRTVTAQADPRLAIDVPAHGSTTGQPLVIAGWAADLGAASGSGVQAVHVYAYPSSGSPIFLKK